MVERRGGWRCRCTLVALVGQRVDHYSPGVIDAIGLGIEADAIQANAATSRGGARGERGTGADRRGRLSSSCLAAR
jgi:hypothetical protein